VTSRHEPSPTSGLGSSSYGCRTTRCADRIRSGARRQTSETTLRSHRLVAQILGIPESDVEDEMKARWRNAHAQTLSKENYFSMLPIPKRRYVDPQGGIDALPLPFTPIRVKYLKPRDLLPAPTTLGAGQEAPARFRTDSSKQENLWERTSAPSSSRKKAPRPQKYAASRPLSSSSAITVCRNPEPFLSSSWPNG
jgi:hypothetical protein